MSYNWTKLSEEAEKKIKSMWLNGKDTVAPVTLFSIFNSLGVPENWAIKGLIKILESRRIIQSVGVSWKIYPDKVKEEQSIKELSQYDNMQPAGDVKTD